MDNELYHFGVLGMKWGRRKASNKTKQSSSKTKKPISYIKRVKSMSTEELQEKVRRLQLEKQYRTLQYETLQPSIAVQGERAIGKAVAQAGTNVLSGYLTKAANIIIKKKFKI